MRQGKTSKGRSAACGPKASGARSSVRPNKTSKGASLQDKGFLDRLEAIGVGKEDREKIREMVCELRNYVPKVGLLGKTGAGKSTLCNAIFGKRVADVSNVEACTRTPQEISISLSERDEPGLVLVDFPGVGESNERDLEYKDLYDNWLPELDLILWVIKADDRALSIDEMFYKKIIASGTNLPPIVFVINQVDKIEPSVEGWDEEKNRPGRAQKTNLRKKAAVIGQRFEVDPAEITAVSAGRGFGLVDLVSRIVTVLPKEKKAAFVRETKAENVSPKTAKEAEKGFWEYIFDRLGDVVGWLGERVEEILFEKLKEIITVTMGL